MTSIGQSPSAQARQDFSNANVDGKIPPFITRVENPSPQLIERHEVNYVQYKDAKKELEPLMRDAVVAEQALKIAISEAQDQGDHQKVAQLRAELRELSTMMREFEVPNPNLSTGDFRAQLDNQLQELNVAVADALTAADSVVTSSSADAPAFNASIPPYKDVLLEAAGRPLPDAVTTKSSGSKETDGAGGKSISEMGWDNSDYDAMMDQLQRDPAGLMAKLDQLDPASKNHALTMLQQRLQEVNRMFSMMSNMQKSIHDTMKAAINNMRV